MLYIHHTASMHALSSRIAAPPHCRAPPRLRMSVEGMEPCGDEGMCLHPKPKP